jgi:hypothetical protein
VKKIKQNNLGWGGGWGVIANAEDSDKSENGFKKCLF